MPLLLLEVRHMELGNLTTVNSDRNLLSRSLAVVLRVIELFSIHNDIWSRMLDTITR